MSDDFETLLQSGPSTPEGVVDPTQDPMFAAAGSDEMGIFGHIDQAERLLVVLHGYDLKSPMDPGKAMGMAIYGMALHYQYSNVAVLSPQYNTSESFVYGARQVRAELDRVARGRPITLFGYSMGGLVSRQMVVDGLPNVTNLLTFCSPHLGTAGWVPLPNRGAQSLGPDSMDLRALLNHPTDQARRKNYIYMGVCYQEAANGQWHMNDGMVESTSQTCGDWRAPNRHMWKSLRQTVWAGASFEPHASAQMSPDIAQALGVLTQVLPK